MPPVSIGARPSRRPSRAATVGLLTLLAAGSAVGALGTSPATAATLNCAALDDPIYHRTNASTGVNLLTPWKSEADAAAAKYGYKTSFGSPFRASITPASGLSAAHLMINPKTGDRTWMSVASERRRAVSRSGYVDHGAIFYVAQAPGTCTVPVYRFLKNKKHAYATTAAQQRSLAAAGWKKEGVTFHAGRKAASATPTPAPPTSTSAADADGKFSIAVYPDTQQEVGSDSRFVDRATYLVAKRKALDLRFVNHVGDVVNWDTPSHGQYRVAQQAMVPLETAKIPYSLSIGNHDTQATGVGGSARDPRRTKQQQRDTSTFNAYFKADRQGAVRGAFEAGKVDNTFSTFNAGGKKWLVLNLELWPRVAAVAWAKNVVATHPQHNVIVSSHNLMSGNGGISGPAAATAYEYGDVNPRYLFDHLILAYPNIRMTLSGHVGSAAQRVDTGQHGNKVVSYLQTFHSNTDNPTRLIEFNVKTNSVTAKVIGIKSGTTLRAPVTTSGLAFR